MGYKAPGVINVSDRFRDAIKAEQARTGVPIETLFLNKKLHPDDLDGPTAQKIIRGTQKQAPRAHLVWISATYRSLPNASTPPTLPQGSAARRARTKKRAAYTA